MSKCYQDGDWLMYSNGDLGLYFSKEENGYGIGLDEFYSSILSLCELKELSNFLVDYIKEQEGSIKWNGQSLKRNS